MLKLKQVITDFLPLIFLYTLIFGLAMYPASLKKSVLKPWLLSIYEVNVKRFCLFFCCGFMVFWGSLAIAFATPIHDDRGGGDGFTCGDAGLGIGYRHFFGELVSGCLEDFPGQPSMGKYNLGSTVYTLKIDKTVQKFNFQNQLGNMEDEQGVSNPVPSTLFLLGTGMIGLAAFRRKKPGRRIEARYQDPEGRHPKIPTGRGPSVIISDHDKPSIQRARA